MLNPNHHALRFLSDLWKGLRYRPKRNPGFGPGV